MKLSEADGAMGKRVFLKPAVMLSGKVDVHPYLKQEGIRYAGGYILTFEQIDEICSLMKKDRYVIESRIDKLFVCVWDGNCSFRRLPLDWITPCEENFYDIE